jgi:hypothetical protein
MRRLWWHSFAVVLFAACATAGRSSGTPARDGGERSSYVISAVDINAHQDLPTAFDLVRRLRPTFRGTVYLDNVRYGTFSSLRQLSSASIREIRQLNESDAALRFGTGAGWVILVTSR